MHSRSQHFLIFFFTPHSRLPPMCMALRKSGVGVKKCCERLCSNGHFQKIMSISFNSRLKGQQIRSIYHIKTIFVLDSIDWGPVNFHGDTPMEVEMGPALAGPLGSPALPDQLSIISLPGISRLPGVQPSLLGVRPPPGFTGTPMGSGKYSGSGQTPAITMIRQAPPLHWRTPFLANGPSQGRWTRRLCHSLVWPPGAT